MMMARTPYMFGLSQTHKFDCSCPSWEGCEFYLLKFATKPVTTNAERAGNRFGRAEATKDWRMMGFLSARQMPKADWIQVVAQPHQQRGRLQDVAACNPSVKALIDGIVDAGVIPDDSSEYLREVRFLPATRESNGLTLTVVLKRRNT